ncbi:protein kinase domain-containing protein [Phormidesmis sp. 146-35]
MIGQLLTGRYLILEKLGAGGFSQTYLARDKYLPRHPLCVVKCLQLPPQSTISLETAKHLFETEATLLEQFGQHHHQIPTLFAYCHEQEDSTYLVQEYIDGETLSQWLAQGNRLTEKSAIALLLELLSILQNLHAQRVIHRDVTPSNLIRRRRDGKIVLIDFGAAYRLAEDESVAHPDTSVPLAIGTPGYMPDEQHLGMAQLNSDLYAAGILVIHLLTGIDPQQFKQDLISGELDWHQHLQPPVSPELTTILNRLVRTKASDRYPQVSDVLADLHKLTGRFQPVVKHWYKAQQFILPTSALLFVGAIVLQLSSRGIITRSMFSGQQAKTTLHQLTQKWLPQSDMQLAMTREVSIKSGIDRVVISPNKQTMITVGTDHLPRLWSLPQGTWRKTLSGYTAPVTNLAISANSKLLLTGREDGTIQAWNGISGKFLQKFKGHQKTITAIAISPDARTFVSTSKDRTLRQWNLQTGALLKTLNSPADITAITYGATSDQLVVASRDHQLQVWNLNTGNIDRTFAGHTDTIVGLELINDHTLISFGKDRGLMWDLNREALIQVLPQASANTILVSKCDRNIITVHGDGTVRIWIPQGGRLAMREVGTLDQPGNVAFSPEHDYLVSWSANKRLRFWQIKD